MKKKKRVTLFVRQQEWITGVHVDSWKNFLYTYNILAMYKFGRNKNSPLEGFHSRACSKQF
ncbi:hypothetical protein KR50_01690 [Jeotgalibacillus campisalis]|uniref:Uncharacterized protein n=1 Tax=Jeotgalibacillus campisalis TaxID=220754 RepID=A0A0C2RRE6_9BACL|nr:hypothetical protein KR50_01690 [Jeotgalibacillus campisalis]